MKRFYDSVSVSADRTGHAILLDGRPVKTPARHPLVLPDEPMARAIADEWEGQGEKINPAAMPLTGFANAAIDRIAPEPARFVREIVAYGETDTLCYRADPGDPLAARQDEIWEPMLRWAEQRYDIRLVRVAGIIHQAQPAHALSRLGGAVEALDPFTLAPMTALTGIGGSLVAALALLEAAFPIDTVWQAVCLEELWQESLWGAEAEAVRARESRRVAFGDAARFAALALAAARER